MEKEKKFMREAIKEAKFALLEGCSPFGSVLVKDGKVEFRAHNTTTKDNDPTAHAETSVIRKACKKLKSKTLKGYTLYTTAEPCAMCMTASVFAEIDKIVYGVPVIDFLRINKERSLRMTPQAWKRIKIKGGFLKRECSELYSGF